MDENKPERELESLQDQADSLGDQITEVREDWDSKKADGSVPGAGGDPLAAHSDHPEAQFPAVGDSGDFEEDHPDAGERLDPADPDNEDL
jgi:hypothetical protein